MIEVSHLCVKYDDREILHDVSAAFPTGAFTVVAGPNGSGKSTLLRALCGILPRAAGEIRVDGTPLCALAHPARHIAYLPQNRPVPDITVERLVLHGRFPYLSYPRRYGQKDYLRARQAMEAMGLSELADTPVRTLSGGVRQKAYLAMALAQDAPVVLLDEPTTYLDAAHQFSLMDRAKALCRAGKTVVAVLHDLVMAARFADHMLVMDAGRAAAQGSCAEILQSGCVETVFGVSLREIDTLDGPQFYLTRAWPEKDGAACSGT